MGTLRKKKEKIEELVSKIKDENIVVNLSNEEIPASAYLFLAKGLGYVATKKVDLQDLKYDTLEFIRKMEWKAYFHENPDLTTGTDPMALYSDIKISNFNQAPTQNSIIGELKTKLLGWIANHEAKAPKSNLTELEQRGKKWVSEKIKEELIFITKADKGGATLIMNYKDVEDAVKKEIFDETKFERIATSADEHILTMRNKVNQLSINLQTNNIISKADKSLITGLSDKNKPKQAPEYRAESPYAYPSFKIHKLSANDIAEKKIPPARLIHASKFSPLYRCEKWCSPHLTRLSRKYCESEFLLDTKDLLGKINELNANNTFENQNIHLFTLDVEKLYPSIQPRYALEALQDMLTNIGEEDRKVGEAIEAFVRLSLDESYVTYKDGVFKPKIGIPTGGSLSRQLADIFLHWLLFKKINTSTMNRAELLFWKRFIDDGIGIWRGTRRGFETFVRKLNKEANKFGINFPIDEIQFGKSVNFLDVTLFLDEHNKIQFKSYSKPTDAKRYLRPQSFHPRNVFESVPLSQMMRTIERNSQDDNKKAEMKKIMNDFVKSGYKMEKLKEIEVKAEEKFNAEQTTEEQDTITFPIFHFKDIKEFKKILFDARDDIQQAIGDTKIVMAVKKNPSIGNSVVRNKQISTENRELIDQKCRGPGCLQCPLVNTDSTITVNKLIVKRSKTLNCKSRNVIYLWQCQRCQRENSYFGRTIQKSHERTNTHRRCFSDEEKWEDSALSMHAHSVHEEHFNLNDFKITLVKKCSPQRIRREEFKFIDKFRTRTRGINRYKN